MKVVNLVLNNFKNDSRVLKTAKTLDKSGYDVKVVALHDAGLKEKDNVENIRVHRIKLVTRNLPKIKLFQLIKLLEFIFRFIRLYRKADTIHCNDLDGLLVGVLCKFTRKKLHLIYDTHEFASNDVPYESKISQKIKYVLERILIRFAEQVITVSESIAVAYSDLYKIPKPHVVHNCPQYVEQSRHNLFRDKFAIRDDQTIFLYQGGFGPGRGIEILLDVFSQFTTDKNILVFMGYGILESEILNKAENFKTIFFHEAVPPSILLDYTSSADFGVIFYEDSCLNHRFCLPNKLFEYLMAGVPVITSQLLEIQRLVESQNIGVVAFDNTASGFREAVMSSIGRDVELMSNNVRRIRKKFCWENQEKVLLTVYSTMPDR